MKGTKMILGALALASLLFSVNASAQNRDSDGNVIRGPYETNKAFDNTSLGVAAGVNMTILHPTSPKTWGNLGLAIDLSFNKWWTPFIGARLGWHGLWNNSKQALDLINNVNANTPFGFNYFHGDVLWNVFNTFGGYKADRFWDLNPYIGMGMLDVTNTRNFLSKNAAHNREYAVGVGLLNVLKVTEKINFTIDLQALVAPSSKFATGPGYIVVFPSATFGLAFNFGRTTFDRHSDVVPAILPVPFTEEEYNALEKKLDALQKENAALKNRAAALQQDIDNFKNLTNGQTYLYENGKFTAVDVKAGAPVTVYFDCGSAAVSAREKAHLEYFAENVVNADTKLLVKGYADKQTGSAKRNQQLSEQRVKAVVDLLKKAGASEANIETSALGATVQPFNSAVLNRVVTVEVK